MRGLRVSTRGSAERPLPYGFAPVWDAVSPLVVALMLTSIVRDIVALVRPHWLMLRCYTGLALHVGGLLVLIRLVRADAVFVVTDPAGIGAAHIGHFNTLFFMVLLVAVFRCLHQHAARAIRHLVRPRTRSTPDHRDRATMPPTS